MIFRSPNLFGRKTAAKTTILLSVVFFFVCAADAQSLKKYSRNFQAGQNVKLQLMNRTGTVTVEGWDKPYVNITAYLESPAANIDPQIIGNTILLNLVRDNQGRGEVGSVIFNIRVPYYSQVDIETKVGDLRVGNIRSLLVRAHISSEGDIQLINIQSGSVSAENVTGNIFFDGELQSGGNYRFTSMKGDISLRIPFSSSFKLVATAPSTRNIALGSFANNDLRYFGDGRRVVGRFGEGTASINVTNQRGSIQFIRR